MPLNISPTIERIEGIMFAAKWKYGNQPDKDKWDPSIGFRFHCGANDVGYSWDRNHGCDYSAPPNGEIIRKASELTELGYESSNRCYVVDHSRFWPNRRRKLTEVVFAIYSSEERTRTDAWPMHVPLQPIITLERDSTAIVAKVNPRASDMGENKGNFYRTFTAVWCYKVEQTSRIPSIGAYSLPKGYSKVDSGQEVTLKNRTGLGPAPTDSAGNPIEINIGTAATVPSIAGTPHGSGSNTYYTPTMVIFYAANEGPSGESTIAWASHVFARPNTCTCTPYMNGDRIDVKVHYNYDEWHPTDALVLERQIAARPVFDNTGTWNEIATYSNKSLNDIANSATMIDAGIGSFEPAVDECTFYRVRTWHDEKTNQNYGYAPLPTLVAKPKPPTVEGEFDSDSNVLTATVDVESAMDVTTWIKVMSGTKVVADWSVMEKTNASDTTITKNITITPEMVGDTPPATHIYQLVAKNVTNKAVYGVEMESSEEDGKSGDIKSDDYAKQIGYTLQTPIIDSITQNPDGTSLTLAWHWPAVDAVAGVDEQGTEIAWTSRSWNSTTNPSTHQVKDGSLLSGVVVIDDLEEGVEYNIEVKRYVTIDGDTGYSLPDRAPDPSRGLYTTPQSTPEKPYLRASSSVPVGSGITYRWTFVDTNDTPQTDAMLIIGDGNPEHQSELISISGSQGSYTYQTTDDDIGTLVATVSVRTGGGWSEPSNEVSTIVAEPPTCTIAAPEDGNIEDGVLTASPLSVALSGTGDSYSVTVTCVSGATLIRPNGDILTAPGQTVAAMELSDGTVEIPCKLVQGARYQVTAVAHDSYSGLSSEPATLTFVVDWSNNGTHPTGTVSIEDGKATITASGNPEDTCNIWRKTSDGPVLAFEDAEWSTTESPRSYIDTIPPFSWGGCGYIIESITPDGYSVWTEIPYELKEAGTVIDWDGGSLSGPWNLDISSRYEREFRRDVHLDGTTSGNWGPKTLASASLSFQLLPGDEETLYLLKELSRSNGICAVRASSGFLMFCDVTVDLRRGYMEKSVSASLSLTGIDDDGTFLMEPGEGEFDSSLEGQ